MTTKNNRISRNASDQQLADGLIQNAKQIGVLTIGGQPYQPADIAKVLVTRIAARNAATQAKVSLATAVAAQKGVNVSSRALVNAARGQLRSMLSNDPNLLGALGLAISEHKPTLATKVAGVAKAQATKVARGTTGKKARSNAAAPVAAAPVAPAAKPQA